MRTKKNIEAMQEMCRRFVEVMDSLPMTPTELSRALGYANPSTLARVKRGEAFVDVERLMRLAEVAKDNDVLVDLQWVITGQNNIRDDSLALADSGQHLLRGLVEPLRGAGTRNDRGATLGANGGLQMKDIADRVRHGLGTIVQGDNSRVLHDLAKLVPGSVRCAYLDPPYNNGDKYTHYVDKQNSRAWAEALTYRLQAVHELLREDGSLWVSIDDSELHHLRMAADNVFGRDNFVSTVIWERRTTRDNRKSFSKVHEYLLVYAKNASRWSKSRNSLPLTPDVRARYKNPDNDPRGAWQSVTATAQAGHATDQQFYTIHAPKGSAHEPPRGRCWVYTYDRMQAEIEQGRIWFGKDGSSVPRLKKYLSERTTGLTPSSLWRAHEVGTTGSAKKHLLSMFSDVAPFDTPKPEALIARILEISTNPGELVIDPYLGSGTTTAVAHKLGRAYLGIEIGSHARTHCAVRMDRVVKGEDGGVSRSVGWQGGGGFEFIAMRDDG